MIIFTSLYRFLAPVSRGECSTPPLVSENACCHLFCSFLERKRDATNIFSSRFRTRLKKVMLHPFTRCIHASASCLSRLRSSAIVSLGASDDHCASHHNVPSHVPRQRDTARKTHTHTHTQTNRSVTRCRAPRRAAVASNACAGTRCSRRAAGERPMPPAPSSRAR